MAEERKAVSPTGSGARGAVAGLFGTAAAAALTTKGIPPELAIAGGTVVVGMLTGAGNAARNTVAKKRGGFWGFFAQLFSFLG